MVHDDDEGSNKFALNLYYKVTSFRGLSARLPSVTESHARGLVELVQSLDTIPVNTGDILDICFVFHRKDPNLEDAISVYGMKSVFVCDSQYDAERKVLHAKEISLCRAFPKCPRHMESFHNQAWKAILRVREALFQCLNRNSIKQGSKQSSKTHLTLSIWTYMKRSLSLHITAEDESLVLPHRQFTGKRKVTQSIPVFAAKSKSVTRNFDLVRLHRTEHLTALRYFFGAYATCGVRRRRPKKNCFMLLKENDCINFVAPSDEDPSLFDTPLSRISYDSGIDFKWYEDSTLVVTVRYSTSLYTIANGTGEATFTPELDHYHQTLYTADHYTAEAGLGGDTDEEDEHDHGGVSTLTDNNINIRVGQALQWNDRLVYRIVSVTDATVTLECIDRMGTPLFGQKKILTTHDEIEELNRALEEYLDSGTSSDSE